MGEFKKKQIELLTEPKVDWLTEWGAPYFGAFMWLFVVMLFAYLQIAIDYFITEEKVPFFEVYSKMQNYYVAIIANLSFFVFAWIDYWQTHRNYKNFELQTLVLVISVISFVCIIFLPPMITYIQEHNGILNSRGNKYPITWICYTMHIIYLFSLLVLRGETQKVRSIDKYLNSYIKNKYEN